MLRNVGVPLPFRAGADCHDVVDEHWINGYPTPVATPMSKYPRYHDYRKSWGINALGGVVVEVEAEGGVTGVGERGRAHFYYTGVEGGGAQLCGQDSTCGRRLSLVWCAGKKGVGLISTMLGARLVPVCRCFYWW